MTSGRPGALRPTGAPRKRATPSPMSPGTQQGSPGGTVAATTDDAWQFAFESVFLGAVRLARVLASSPADEHGPFGIRINGLPPVRLATDRVRQLNALLGDPNEVRARLSQDIPRRRYGEPAEFGQAAAFILSPAAAHAAAGRVEQPVALYLPVEQQVQADAVPVGAQAGVEVADHHHGMMNASGHSTRGAA